MRLELKEGINGSLLIDDAYHSDINSLSIALDYLHNMAAGRPMTLILSDIEQSGVEDGVLYGEVARLVAAAGVSRLIGVGDRIRNAGANFACDSAFTARPTSCCATCAATMWPGAWCSSRAAVTATSSG